MPRIETMAVAIRTGQLGTASPVKLSFNGFDVALDDTKGSTEVDGLYEGTFEPNSVPHAVTLQGPDDGAWEIAEVRVVYTLDGEAPYTVSFGSAAQPIRLDATNQLQIWAARPLPTFDV